MRLQPLAVSLADPVKDDGDADDGEAVQDALGEILVVDGLQHVEPEAPDDAVHQRRRIVRRRESVVRHSAGLMPLGMTAMPSASRPKSVATSSRMNALQTITASQWRTAQSSVESMSRERSVVRIPR